ncbi:hypothetical protein [Mycolicibacterium sp. S3B2]|uniref:hypothetical protein n=1 Tax=Mycolicibacterium sp. S3B2 TaxID=3415120 RepID=UPI003C7CF375
MADSTSDASSARRRQGNWRHRENRASSKYVAKRVSADDHAALTKYAEDQGVKVAELLSPFIDDLIQRAHEHAHQLDDVSPAAKAS